MIRLIVFAIDVQGLLVYALGFSRNDVYCKLSCSGRLKHKIYRILEGEIFIASDEG